jgi:hypothetical protein
MDLAIMRRFVPSTSELAVFAILALVFAVVVMQINPQRMDLGTAGLAMPMFLVAAVLGLRKSPLWTMSAPAQAEADVDGDEEAEGE